MHGHVSAARIPLELQSPSDWSRARVREPVTFGVPLPVGLLATADALALETRDEGARAIQSRVLDRWPDGSIRWLLVDAQHSVDTDGRAEAVALCVADAPTSFSDAIRVEQGDGEVTVHTGRAAFTFASGRAFPVSGVTVDGRAPFRDDESGLDVDLDGTHHRFVVDRIEVRESGPLRAELLVTARPAAPGFPLRVTARVDLYSASATARVAVTLRNPRRAEHPGGRWTLGDPGSVSLRSAELRLALAGGPGEVRAAVESGQPLIGVDAPFALHQESSGGEHWDAPTHRDRTGAVPVRFRGYRQRAGASGTEGLRAEPIVIVTTGAGEAGCAVPLFWQHAPRAISVESGALVIGLFPARGDETYELQGGEQKTHVVMVAAAPDAVSDPALAWCHAPQILSASADWCCRSGALPWLQPPALDDPAYAELAGQALDPDVGFFAKRERADEYGWRDFGDLPADHESAFETDGRQLVSHYNNQYDALAAFAMHFLRSGDRRWWSLMDDLARHVRDIDIYHTDEDKAAYSGGLFWHTYHYVDAGTATHRTYSADGPASGGPSAEHNYNLGLMLHYFLTGDRESRDTAIDLGRWVLRMDDGARTPFRWLAGGPTGLASASGSMAYHGPGRGAGNSVLACLVAYRLSGEQAFRAKADELIDRCIHPEDDIAALNLLDAERRWFYTVFLQVLGDDLQDREERGAVDARYACVRDTLLHYARWMVEHERPYLDHPEGLEFPTETWAAQDLRKADVLYLAAWHAEGAERDRFIERAEFFWRYALDTLKSMPTSGFTRPLVLVLRHGLRPGWLAGHLDDAPTGKAGAACTARPPRPAFRPQRAVAVRRAVSLVAAVLVLAMTAALLR